MTAVLQDYRSAPIPEAHKALFRFIEIVNRQSNQIRRQHLDEVRRAGWSDDAIYDAITVSACSISITAGATPVACRICRPSATRRPGIASPPRGMSPRLKAELQGQSGVGLAGTPVPSRLYRGLEGRSRGAPISGQAACAASSAFSGGFTAVTR